MNRRQAIGALSAAVGAAISGACTGSPASPSSTSNSTSTTTTGGTTSSTCAVAPTETIGPYPDQTGMLSNMAFYRRDVTEGRPGTPLALTITVQNTNANCAALANAAVEIWQCDAD